MQSSYPLFLLGQKEKLGPGSYNFKDFLEELQSNQAALPWAAQGLGASLFEDSLGAGALTLEWEPSHFSPSGVRPWLQAGSTTCGLLARFGQALL